MLTPALLPALALAAFQSVPDSVSSAFASPGLPLAPAALEVFDDGRGAALYLGGSFEAAGPLPAHRVARWDGLEWEALGDGPDLHVRALKAFEDGPGGAPLLYAGGLGVQALQRFDGANWYAVPSEPQPGGEIRALTVFDGGGGPELIAGGDFTELAGASLRAVGRYDGTSWQALGQGLDGWVGVLATFDGGSGPELLAAGYFKLPGLGVRRLARWDGTSWKTFGAAVFDAGISALTVYDGELIAAGAFTRVGSVSARGLARWDGTRWAAVGSGTGPIGRYGLAGSLWAVAGAAQQTDAPPELVVGGSFRSIDGVPARNLAAWNGTRWRELGVGLDGTVTALASVNFSGSPAGELFAGGVMGVGAGAAHGISRWDGHRWSALTRGLGLFGAALDLQVFDDGSGPGLFVCGWLGNAGGTEVGGVARWDGSGWSPVGSGVARGAESLAVFDDGTGPALYLGGGMAWIGDLRVDGMARWDGDRWSALGAGVSGYVSTQAVLGDSLYVAGRFEMAGQSYPVGHIARWDGVRWWDLDGGLNASVHSLAVFDDGAGPALYVAGNFWIAGSQPVLAYGFARWDGSAWSAVPGSSGLTSKLLAWDLGSGQRLFGTGYKQFPNGELAAVWQWDGATWERVGDGAVGILSQGTTLGVFEGRDGPVLLAGGYSAVDPSKSALARWDGAAWTEVVRTDGWLADLATFDDGAGLALFAAGGFTLVDHVPSSRFARLGTDRR